MFEPLIGRQGRGDNLRQRANNWLAGVCGASNMYDMVYSHGSETKPREKDLLCVNLNPKASARAWNATKGLRLFFFLPFCRISKSFTRSRKVCKWAVMSTQKSNLAVAKPLRGDLFSFCRLVIMSFGISQPSTFSYCSAEKSRFALRIQVKRKQKVLTLGLPPADRITLSAVCFCFSCSFYFSLISFKPTKIDASLFYFFFCLIFFLSNQIGEQVNSGSPSDYLSLNVKLQTTTGPPVPCFISHFHTS